MAASDAGTEREGMQRKELDGKKDRVVEIVFQNKIWAGPVMNRILKRINGTIPDPRDLLDHSSVSRLLNGKYTHKYHKGCTARYVSAPDGYVLLPANTEWVE